MQYTKLNKSILAAAVAIFLVACASREPVSEPVEQPNVYVGKDAVYSVLQRRGDGQWIFADVTDINVVPENGFLVRLNDLSPAFDTREAECEPRAYRENDRCNPVHPFRKRNMGVVGKIVDTGITAGTGGKLSGVGRSYSTEFDQLAFNAAVDQALLLTGLDENRVAFLNGIERISETAARQKSEIEELKTQMLLQYKIDKEENIRFDARVSGLRQYYSDDLDPNEFVEILTDGPADVEVPAKATEISVLPCTAEKCVGQLNQALASLDQQHATQLASLKSDLLRQTDAYVVDCSATEHDGYQFRLHCPDKLERNRDGLILLPVEIEILSRDFPNLFPEFTASNDELAAAVEGGDLVLGNRTGEFVDVQSVSVYYNSRINTDAKVGTRLDLAPYQFTRVPVGEFTSPEIDIESRYTNMTPDKASRATFSFGLAIKYSLRDKDAVETLYGLGDFNVQCAIESRLQPGSCKSDLSAPEENPADSDGPAEDDADEAGGVTGDVTGNQATISPTAAS